MIVIVGSGLAGYMLAKEVRKLNPHCPLTIITASRGDFYSKPLLSTALTSQKTPEQLAMSSADDMANQLNAQVLTQTSVEAIDREKKSLSLSSGETLVYDQLVLACGSAPLQVPLQGDAVADLFSINDLEAYADYRAWLGADKKHLAILGSGLVGCEFANDLLNTGYDIDIISLDQYPLAKFVPEPIGRVVQSVFAEEGVRWHMGTPAKSVDHVEGRFAVSLANGETITADGVISAVGLSARTRLAEHAGLKVNRGIVVDRQLKTTDDAIFALGDCAEVSGELKQYVAPILQCARTLAKVLTGEPAEVSYPAMPIVIKLPTCPLVTIPVPLGVEGEWKVEGEGAHQCALFYDTNQQLRGFSLTGDRVKEKMALAKQLPLVFG